MKSAGGPDWCLFHDCVVFCGKIACFNAHPSVLVGLGMHIMRLLLLLVVLFFTAYFIDVEQYVFSKTSLC